LSSGARLPILFNLAMEDEWALEMTLRAGMIIVCSMFNDYITCERYDHDPQTIYKNITDNIIAKYVDLKPYA
jgi:hypothetical protein